MKTIKTLGFLLLITIFISSCEDKYHVSKVFIDETTQKPIPGLLVGFYKSQGFSWDTPIDALKLISTAKTDATGRVVFEVIDDDFKFTIDLHLFLPIYSSDSLSVNAKHYYKVKMENYPVAGWGLNEVIEMSPYYRVDLHLAEAYTGNDYPLIIKYENQQSYLNKYDSDFEIYLRPGEFNKFKLYKTVNNEEVFVADKTVYVKFNDHPNRYIFDLPYSIIDFKL